MTAGTPNSDQDLAQNFERLSRQNNELIDKLDRLSNGLERLSQYERQREEQQKWQDRTWDVVKFVGTIASSLAVASAIALIGLLIGKAG